MGLDDRENLKDVFRRADRGNLQKALRTGEDWDRFKAIQRQTDARLMTEQSAYKRDFAQRLAEAKEIILREENGLRLDLPVPSWVEARSTATQLDQKAGERVRRDHERRITVIEKDELDAYRALTAEIRARDAPEQQASLSQTWKQTRSGPSRS